MKGSTTLAAIAVSGLLIAVAIGFVLTQDTSEKIQEIEEETYSDSYGSMETDSVNNSNPEDVSEKPDQNKTETGEEEEIESEEKEINITRRYYLTPEKPQEVRIEIEYNLPSVDMPDVPNEYFRDDYKIVNSEGFEIKESDSRYISEAEEAIWNGETRNPSIELKKFFENETATFDNGNWSLLIPYQEATLNKYPENVNLDYEAEPDFIRIDSAKDRIFVGNYSVESREFENHKFRLVIEENSDFTWEKERFFERMREVGNDLHVNHTLSNDSVVTGISVDDFKGGGGKGGGVILVENRKDSGGTPYYGIWTEEYIHNLQPLVGDSMSFTVDGFAQYFTQYYHLKWGINNYSQFRSYTMRLNDYYSKDKQKQVILTNSDTWFEDGNHYAAVKKVAVLAALDYRIHKATDGKKSLIDAYQKIPSMNSYPPPDYVTAKEFKNIVENTTGREFDKFFEKYISGQKYPELPEDSEKYMETMNLVNN
jgi:hypothetical protein